jgi:uncharacterized protein (TIGR02271 family)
MGKRFQEQSTPGVEQVIIPVVAEELHVAKEAHVTGGIRVRRQVEEHDESVEIPLLKEAVDVRRVLVDREVDGPLPVRQDGDTTIVPIVEEVPVIAKRFVLKEEIYITRSVREEVHQERVTVRRQDAQIERVDGKGQAVPVQDELPKGGESGQHISEYKKRVKKRV